MSSKIWPAAERNIQQLADVLLAMQDVKVDGTELLATLENMGCYGSCSCSKTHGPMEEELDELREAVCRIESEIVALCCCCVMQGKGCGSKMRAQRGRGAVESRWSLELQRSSKERYRYMTVTKPNKDQGKTAKHSCVQQMLACSEAVHQEEQRWKMIKVACLHHDERRHGNQGL